LGLGFIIFAYYYSRILKWIWMKKFFYLQF
jgi:hypothetical protein